MYLYWAWPRLAFSYRCYILMQRKLIHSESHDVVFVEDPTIEHIEMVKGSKTQIDSGFIDFGTVLMTKDATHGDVRRRR